MDKQEILARIEQMQAQLSDLAAATAKLGTDAMAKMPPAVADIAGPDPFIFLLTVFVLAVFVGFFVVWSVTQALHSPLMGVTNAISSVIIVGALIAVGPAEMSISKVMGFVAVMLASVNIFGGFIVTQRMLAMFKKKQKK